MFSLIISRLSNSITYIGLLTTLNTLPTGHKKSSVLTSQVLYRLNLIKLIQLLMFMKNLKL